MTIQEVPDQPKKGIWKFWKPKKDDAHREGTYVRRDPPKEGKEKFGDTCILQVADGTELKLPNHEILSGKMSKVPFGALVWIDYIGKGDDGKTYLYTVKFDTNVQQPLTMPHATAAEAQDADRKLGVVKIMTELKSFVGFWEEGIIPEVNIKQVILKVGYSGTATDEMFQRLKAEGLLVYAGNGLKVVV